MRVKKITIRNVMGVEERTIEPGRVTRIQGRNASGKTSTLEAIKSVIQGGHDATLLRVGQEEGEVVLVLEDGEDEIAVRKRITAEKSDLTVTHPTMGKISAGKRWLDGLVDRLSFNPVDFLTADAKTRVHDSHGEAPTEPSDAERALREIIAQTGWLPVGPVPTEREGA